MARSSSISSRLFGGGANAADIAALKAELAALKSGGVGISQDTLDALNKTIKEAKDIAIANDSKISNLENAVPSRDELTLAVADLPKKADKTALESLNTTVTGINQAVSENVAAINGEITAIKAAATTEGTTRASADTALGVRVTALEARKEIKEKIVNTFIYDGKALPTVNSGNPRVSGFNGDGTSDVLGATSWNSWDAVGVDLNQTGTDNDTFIVSLGVNNAMFYQMDITIGGVNARYSKSGGLVANGLPVVEFNDGNCRGMTYRVKKTLLGNCAFVGFNGLQAYWMVIKKETLDGYTVDGNKISPTAELADLEARLAVLEAMI